MYNINDINNGNETKMTIFYFKSSGIIREMSTGVQNMSSYGIHQADYEQILDYIVADLDMYVYDHPNQFMVVDGKLKLKSTQTVDLSKYV